MKRLVLVAFLLAACGDSGGLGSTTTPSTAIAPSTTTTVAATTTTTVAPTTIAPTTTTVAPTTTAAPTTTVAAGPSQVTGLAVGLGGGSLEVAVTWDPHPDADHYRVYFSELPGGDKEFVREVEPTEMVGSQVGFIDYPRNQTEGETCYVVSAVDGDGIEGPVSVEACFYS
jgi:hypothetical protein